MKRTFISNGISFLAQFAALLVFLSCSTDAENREIAEDDQLSVAELQMLMQSDRGTGVADEILIQLYQNGGAFSGKFADEQCYQATYTKTGFKVVFGNCVLKEWDKVSGTLEVSYNKDDQDASFTAFYRGIFVGASELNGTRTFTLNGTGEAGFHFSVVSDMTISLPAGELIRESGFKNTVFRFGDSMAGSLYQITGDWTIATRADTYSVFVESPLTGNLGCPYLTSGLLEISKNGLTVKVDMGDGACDGFITVMYPNGATKQIML